MAKKTKRFVLGEGYPWYKLEQGLPGQNESGYYGLTLYSKPLNFGYAKGTKKVPLKIQWGAWKKVRILIEEVK